MPVHKFGVEDDIALLRRTERLEVRQTLPVLQVLRAYDARRRNRRGQIAAGAVLAFGAEYAVNPAVFMLRQAHIVDVRFLRAGIGEDDRIIPEAEALSGLVGFRDGEERLAIHPFDAYDEAVLAVQLDCAAVHGGIHAQPLHHEGVRRGVSVVHPEGRDVLAGEDRVAVAGIKPVIEVVIGGVRARDEALVGLHQGGKTADLHSSGRSFALFV